MNKINVNKISLGHTASFYALVAITANAGMDIATKFVASDVSSWQGVVLRWGYATLLLLPLVFTTRGFFKEKLDVRVHGLRLILNLFASAALFYSLAKLDLSVVLSIFFLEPIFMMLAAVLLFRQKVTTNQFISILLGFFGVITLIAPDPTLFNEDSTALFVALGGSISWGIMHVLTQQYGKQQSLTQLVFWLAIMTTITATYPAFQTWQPINIQQHGMMVLVAILGTVYSFLWIKALKIASAASIAGYSYLTLPLAYIAGAVFFGEHPSLHAFMGSAIILLSVFLASTKNVSLFKKWNRYKR